MFKKVLGGHPNTVLSLAVAAGASFWFADSFIDSTFFEEHSILTDMFHPEPVEVYIRLFVFSLFTLFGFYARDIIGRLKQAEEASAENERRVREMLETVPLAVVMLDRDARVTFCNDTLLSLVGHDHDRRAVIGRDWFGCFVPERQREEARADYFNMLGDGGYPSMREGHVLTRNGKDRLVSWRNAVMRDVSGMVIGMTGMGEDVTELREAEDSLVQKTNLLDHAAHHDHLTGLPNRKLFDERLSAALSDPSLKGRKTALLLLDLDRFKEINDTLGHQAGDAILKGVSARLSACIRGTDIVARIGGDEFGMVLPAIRHEWEAENAARRVLDAMREPFAVDGQDYTASVSIGIAIYPRDGRSPELLISKADKALYLAKARGRNKYQVFLPETARDYRTA